MWILKLGKIDIIAFLFLIRMFEFKISTNKINVYRKAVILDRFSYRISLRFELLTRSSDNYRNERLL